MRGSPLGIPVPWACRIRSISRRFSSSWFFHSRSVAQTLWALRREPRVSSVRQMILLSGSAFCQPTRSAEAARVQQAVPAEQAQARPRGESSEDGEFEHDIAPCVWTSLYTAQPSSAPVRHFIAAALRRRRPSDARLRRMDVCRATCRRGIAPAGRVSARSCGMEARRYRSKLSAARPKSDNPLRLGQDPGATRHRGPS